MSLARDMTSWHGTWPASCEHQLFRQPGGGGQPADGEELIGRASEMMREVPPKRIDMSSIKDLPPCQAKYQ